MRAIISASLACVLAAGAFATTAMADDTGIATSLHNTVRKGSLLCLATHEHVGSSQAKANKKKALAAAIHDWRGFTAWEYGTDWASWRRAHNKQITCSGGKGNVGCTIAASPCRKLKRRRRHR